MKESLNLDESKTEDLTIPESLCVEVSYEKALGILVLLKELGLNELNLSTGDDIKNGCPLIIS